MRVFVVIGHGLPAKGTHVTVHRTAAGANERAAELTRILAQSIGCTRAVTVDTWESVAGQIESTYRHCYVFINEQTVQS